MQIIYREYPPNYEAITKVFDIKDNINIVFTYGNKLYIPSGQVPDKHLMQHEETHARQQAAIGIEEWWSIYLKDAKFRFDQELEAYRNQYRSMGNLTLERRVGYLSHIATDLAGPMYGNLMTAREAVDAITKDIILKPKPTGNSTKSMRQAKKLKRQNRKKGRK